MFRICRHLRSNQMVDFGGMVMAVHVQPCRRYCGPNLWSNGYQWFVVDKDGPYIVSTLWMSVHGGCTIVCLNRNIDIVENVVPYGFTFYSECLVLVLLVLN